MEAARDPEEVLCAGIHLAELGLPVHWLRPAFGGPERGRGKAPVELRWQAQPFVIPAALRKSFVPGYNVGVRTGRVVGAPRSVVVVDLDGPTALNWGRAHLPSTPVRTRTGRVDGGEHWYYRQPDFAVRTRAGAVPHVDVRGDRGQVVVAPSVHPTTHLLYQEAIPWTGQLLDALPAYNPQWFADTDTPEGYLQAAAPAITGQGGHDQTFEVVLALLRRFALTPEAAVGLLLAHYNPRCTPPWTPDELAHKVKDAQALIHKTPARPRARSLGEVAKLLSTDMWQGVLAYDVFRRRIVCSGLLPWGSVGDWTDVDDARAVCWLEQTHALRASPDVVRQAVTLVAADNEVHPVRQYLQSCVWDGRSRLDTVLWRYFHAPDTSYVRLVGAWWMISAVARALHPGCKVDHALILEGKQAARKSTALEVLAVHREWFTDSTLPIGDRGAYELIEGKWIVEFAELESWRKTDQRKLKAFITSNCDTFRPSYGKYTKDCLRQCVFAGTTNETHYLEDATGGRRFWPVACDDIDVGALRADRDQLWAEAMQRFLGGERWWPEGGEVQLCEEAQEARRDVDEWLGVLSAWLDGPAGSAHLAAQTLTTGVVLAEVFSLQPSQWTRAHRIRVGGLFAQLGLVRCREGGGGRGYYYSRRDSCGALRNLSSDTGISSGTHWSEAPC